MRKYHKKEKERIDRRLKGKVKVNVKATRRMIPRGPFREAQLKSMWDEKRIHNLTKVGLSQAPVGVEVSVWVVGWRIEGGGVVYGHLGSSESVWSCVVSCGVVTRAARRVVACGVVAPAS